MRIRLRSIALIADRRGAAVLEFAIVAPALFALVLGAVDVGRMFYVRQGLEYATEQAAHYYVLNPNSASSAVTTYLRTQMAGGMGSSILAPTYDDTTPCNGQANVTCTMITATYSFSFIAGYLGLGTITLKAKAQAVRVTS